jgi:Domain of unknown function (DUF4384)/Sel1 repeat
MPHRALLLLIGVLGLMLRAGPGAADDLAADRAAAAAGDPAALVRLAERYETGAGVPFDLEVATALFELAAERGDAVAQYRLGLLQAGGLAPEADPAEAYQWLRLAAENAADAPVGLLAGAMGEVLEERLDDAALERAGQRIAAFQPARGPAEIPTLAHDSAPGGDPTSLAALLPTLGCGAPATATGSDGTLTLLAYAPSGAMVDGTITPGIRADLARRGAALDVTLLSPAVCAIRAVTAQDQGAADVPGVSLAGVDGSRAVLRDGDMLVVDVAAASEPRYLSVDYVVHTGQVWHLHPPAGDDGYLPAGQSLRLGDGADGAAWQVGAPFGADLLLVSVSPAPFGVDRQPGEESVEAYRARLQQRLQPASGDPVRVFERVVETRAR